MDRPDEEFENYLRQFQLRTPGPLNEHIQVKTRRNPFRVGRWAMAAAVLLAVSLTSIAIVRVFRTPSGFFVRIENPGSPSLYAMGQRIETGQVVRSNSSQGLVLSLEDSSKIEMRSESELSLEKAEDGARIQLKRGSIIVEAAKQKSGHLYVKTADAVVSVVGTVFLVQSDPAGTHVAVMQGEVRVDHGGKSEKIRPGEQIATSPSMPLISIREKILWSKNVVAYLTMLPPAPVSVSQVPRQQAVASGVPQNENAPVSRPSLPPLPPLPADPQPVAGRPFVPGAGSDLERACGTCHLASVAYSIGPDVDTVSMERRRIEMAEAVKQLKARGYSDTYPPVESAESQLKQLDDQLAAAREKVSNYVSKHFRAPGISDQDLSAVIDAILRSRPPVPSPPSPTQKKLK